MSDKTATEKLVAAIQDGDAGAVHAAIASRPDYNALIDQLTPLHWAIFCDQFEIVKMLLDAGAPVDGRDEMDTTPLMTCSLTRADAQSDDRSTKYAELLLARGAQVNPRCDTGHIHLPLVMARDRGKVHLASLLEMHGARTFDVTIQMLGSDGQPVVDRFYYGPTWVNTCAIGESDSQGYLRLEDIIEGPFQVGFSDDRVEHQQITIGSYGEADPLFLIWNAL